MKIVCLEASEETVLKATRDGRKKWMRWLEKMPEGPIEMDMVPPMVESELPDFPKASTLSLTMSNRAFEVLGAESVQRHIELNIPGASGYRLCWTRKLESYLAVDPDRPRRLVFPLRLLEGATLPDAILESRWPFSGAQGEFFAPEATWRRVVAAGLTGLKVVGEYEVQPA